MVMSFSKNLYCQQVPHGSFVMGRSNPKVNPNHAITSSWSFLDEMAKTIVEILPLVGNLRIVRQWGGSYNMSPDRQPIIGEVEQLPGFYLACGFSGHGFMFSPMTGLLLAEIILKKPLTIDISELNLSRFKNSSAVAYEKSVV
jgi:sarcosine oxidase subunit beta